MAISAQCKTHVAEQSTVGEKRGVVASVANMHSGASLFPNNRIECLKPTGTKFTSSIKAQVDVPEV